MVVPGSLNAASGYPGAELDHADGRLVLGTGQQLTLAELLRLDAAGGVGWVDQSRRQWLYANQEQFVGAASSTQSAPSAASVVLEANQRSQLLAQAIPANAVRGARVESQGPVNAVVPSCRKFLPRSQVTT